MQAIQFLEANSDTQLFENYHPPMNANVIHIGLVASPDNHYKVYVITIDGIIGISFMLASRPIVLSYPEDTNLILTILAQHYSSVNTLLNDEEDEEVASLTQRSLSEDSSLTTVSPSSIPTPLLFSYPTNTQSITPTEFSPAVPEDLPPLIRFSPVRSQSV